MLKHTKESECDSNVENTPLSRELNRRKFKLEKNYKKVWTLLFFG